MYILNVFIAAIFGAYVGKFLSLVAHLLPGILLDDNESDEPGVVFKKFFQKPVCPQCHIALSWIENAPIIGYFLSGGKCQKCKSPIAKKTVFVPIFVAALFGVSILFFKLDWTLFFLLFISCLLILCFITDFEHSILPDQFTLTLVWIGLIASLFPIFITPKEAIFGAVFGYGFFWLLNAIYHYVRGKEGMYPGDFKLNAGIGACFGVKLLLIIITASLFILFFVTLFSFFMLNKKTSKKFLFQEAPYGCYSTIVTSVIMLTQFLN